MTKTMRTFHFARCTNTKTLRYHFASEFYDRSNPDGESIRSVAGSMDAELLDAECPASSVCGRAIIEAITRGAAFLRTLDESEAGLDEYAMKQILAGIKIQCNVIYFG